MTRVFAQVIHGASTLKRIALALDKSLNWISEIVNQLEDGGFIIKKRGHNLNGSRISVEVSGTNHALKLKELMFKYQTLNFEKILADSKLLFLAALSEDWVNIKEASKLSKVSKYMIARYRKSLMNRGIITRKNALYKVNSKAWPILHEFLLAYKNYSTLNGDVRWRYQDEIIFSVDSENLVMGSTTGLIRYRDYGIPVRIVSALCRLPEKKLFKEEIFVHSLFELEDPRTLYLALTFYLKNKLKYKKVLSVAMRYGKFTMFQNLVKLVKTTEKKIKLEALPAFDRLDFKRVAYMYGVKNV